MTNGHSSKKDKKKAPIVEDDEEIASDTDIESDEEQTAPSGNGPVRLDNLLLNEEADDDDQGNIHEQRLQRAKEYIEQLAKKGLMIALHHREKKTIPIEFQKKKEKWIAMPCLTVYGTMW